MELCITQTYSLLLNFGKNLIKEYPKCSRYTVWKSYYLELLTYVNQDFLNTMQIK